MAIKQHKLRSTLITTLAVMVIIFAVLFSLFRVAIPHITNYGEDIEAELTRQLGMTVEIGMVNADIAWLVPRLKLLDVNLYETKANRLFFHFEEINLSIGWLKTLQNLKLELGSISLVGLNLNIERDNKNNYIIQGFEVESNGVSLDSFSIADELKEIIDNSSIYLIDSVVNWSDQLNNNQKIVFNEINLALINDAPGHKLSVNMLLPREYGGKTEFILDIKGSLMDPLSWDGSMFFGAKNLKLEKWFDDYWQYIDFTGSGELDVNAWVEWNNKQLTEVNAELNANKLALHYLDDDVRLWELDGIEGKARWRQQNNGWKLDVRELAIANDKRAWPVDSSVAVKMDQSKNNISIKSNFLRIEDLVHLAGLGVRFIPQSEFDWNTKVAPYHPRGDIYDLNVSAPLNLPEQTKVNARFVDLSYKSLTSAPSVNGLDGQLIYDGKGTVVRLDSRNVSLNFNDLFRNELFFDLIKGDVGIYNDRSGWLVQSDFLTVNSPHISSLNYFKIKLPVNEPAYMDLVSHFEKGEGAYTGLYLPVKIMSDELVNWLDNALVDMDIPSGGVVYHGYFQDFPFVNDEGVFEVLFDVENATLKYMQDWPALKNMQAKVRFHNQGMSINQSAGTVFGASFHDTEINIDNFDKAHVSVNGDLHGPLFDVLKFVEQSPLKDVLGSYITSFGVEGDTDMKLNLEIPISTDDPTQVAGLLFFKDNSVYLPEENYYFKEFNGQLKFTEKGAWAKKLSAKLDGFPLDMSVSTINKNKKSTTHLSAQGYLSVKSLLSPVEIFKPYLSGKTNWNINIYIPESSDEKEMPIDIFVHSNLKGIRSTMPGPFAMKADDQAPFKLHLGIYSDELKTYTKYGEDFKLSANLKAGQWTASIDAPSLKGEATFMGDLSIDKVANINLDYINISKFKAEDDAPESSLQGNDIPPIEFFSRKLDWKDKTFTDVNMQTQRIKAGMKIKHLELHAPGISVMGSGLWSSSWVYKNTTELDFKLEISNLGLGLNKLNISESIKNAKGEAVFKWQWHAEPYKFDWNILQGDASFKLEDGSFTDIDAGAGRLLGVLNFETIFSLDFRKQVADGFSFDDMKAGFKFSNGHAFSKDIEIESKVADIKMQGRIGLADKDYNLEVEVTPKVSNAFTAIGVATGGPVLGIGVHLFQKLFGIDKAAGSRSTVTGSWDNPVITEVDKPTANETISEDDDAF